MIFFVSPVTKKKGFPIPRAYVFEKGSPAYLLRNEEPESLASFAVWQWVQLDWPIPGAVVPMPNCIKEAFSFAEMLNCPFVKALSKIHEYVDQRLEENQTILLFDVNSEKEDLLYSIDSLSKSSPKKMYLLSLLP